MTTTIPRAEVQAIADRHDDPSVMSLIAFNTKTIRHYADLLRTAHDNAEADDLDALADRYEREAG
jgi:hypothetical protein